MVTSHLWLSVQEHPYLMNAITIHAIAHTYCSPWVDQPLPTIQRCIGVQSLACNLFEHIYVTNEHVTGEAVNEF